MPLKPVVHWGVDLCCGGELLTDGGRPSLRFQLRGRPGVSRVAARAMCRLPAVGGESVIHESLIWGKAVGLPLGGGICSFSIQRTGRCRMSGGRSIESVVSSVVHGHTVGRVGNGDLSGSSAWRVLLRWCVEMVLGARVASWNICWTVVGKVMRKRVSGHSRSRCHGDDTSGQAGSMARAALMQG